MTIRLRRTLTWHRRKDSRAEWEGRWRQWWWKCSGPAFGRRPQHPGWKDIIDCLKSGNIYNWLLIEWRDKIDCWCFSAYHSSWNALKPLLAEQQQFLTMLSICNVNTKREQQGLKNPPPPSEKFSEKTSISPERRSTEVHLKALKLWDMLMLYAHDVYTRDHLKAVQIYQKCLKYFGRPCTI